MRRRDFLGFLGGATAIWPLAARPQQADRVRRIGVVETTDTPDQQARFAEIRQALHQLGWVDGSNVQSDFRRVSSDVHRIQKELAELVGLTPDVILAVGSNAERLVQVTRTVPVVFVFVPDPVGSGLVERLSRPGGNATGFMQFEYSLCGKWLELLK